MEHYSTSPLLIPFKRYPRDPFHIVPSTFDLSISPATVGPNLIIARQIKCRAGKAEEDLPHITLNRVYETTKVAKSYIGHKYPRPNQINLCIFRLDSCPGPIPSSSSTSQPQMYKYKLINLTNLA